MLAENVGRVYIDAGLIGPMFRGSVIILLAACQGEKMDSCTNDEEFVSAINELFNEKIPFNKVLCLKVESISYEHVRISFPMRDELMGHYDRGMLHGGVISSVIDVAGGLSAFMGIQQKMQVKNLEARFENFGRLSTIDVRIDFLRPGIGKYFVATAYVLRTGKKIAVTRIELKNDQNHLIAVGTGSYVVA
jgi:uncharacterized protein (TIGR00369 family)